MSDGDDPEAIKGASMYIDRSLDIELQADQYEEFMELMRAINEYEEAHADDEVDEFGNEGPGVDIEEDDYEDLYEDLYEGNYEGFMELMQDINEYEDSHSDDEY